jgi:hypothetical protein
MIFRWPSWSNRPASPVEIALLVDGFGGGVRALVVTVHQRRRFDQHFAVVGQFDLDAGAGRPTLSNLIWPSGCRQM